MSILAIFMEMDGLKIFMVKIYVQFYCLCLIVFIVNTRNKFINGLKANMLKYQSNRCY